MITIANRFRYATSAAVVLGAACFLSSGAASANNVTLSGTGQMYWTAQFLGSASGNTQSTPTPTGSTPTGNAYTLAVPGEYGFIDQFAAPQTSPLVNVSSLVGSYAFQDTYEFSVGQAATGDVLAVSLALQAPFQNLFNISDLQFRLYQVPSSATPGLTLPTGSTLLTAWQGVSGNDNGQSISTSFSDLTVGTYFLDIAGTADGTSGGTYVGQLNLSPVPLPGTLPLLLSAVAGLGLMARRRTTALAGLA